MIDDNLLARTPVQKLPLDPDVADSAPSDPVLTVYDEEHLITYLRLLDADAEGADWRETQWCCILNLNKKQSARGERSRAIYRAPDG